MRHRDHRQTGRRQPRQIAKDVAAAHEVLDAVAQQVGAGALDQLHIGQLVLQRQFLHPQRLVEAVGLQRAGIDAGIIGADHAAHARDEADAGDDPAAGHALVGVGHIEHVSRQCRQLDKGRAGIEHQRHPFARQQLSALVKPILGGGRCRARPLFQRTHSRNQRQHPGAIGLVGIAGRRDRRFKDGHGRHHSCFRHSGAHRRCEPRNVADCPIGQSAQFRVRSFEPSRNDGSFDHALFSAKCPLNACRSSTLRNLPVAVIGISSRILTSFGT